MADIRSTKDVDGSGKADLMLCSSCGSVLDPASGLCPRCLMPSGDYASLDPMQAARVEGLLISKAVDKRPKPIVVIGIWVMFLPAFIAGLAVAAQVVLDGAGSGMSGFLFFWIGVGLSIFSLVVLFKVTRNYFRPSESDDGG